MPRKKMVMSQRYLLFFLFLLFTLRATSQEIYEIRIGSGCVNVRNDHSTSAGIIACLPAGTHVTVTGSVPFWRKILFGDNQQGWIAKKFIVPVTQNLQTDTLIENIPPDAYLSINFIDVGQGDAIWIQTWDDGIDGNGIFEGYTIIIDGGPYSADDKNALYKKLKAAGHEQADIESLVVTHPHIDHFAGAETLIRHFNINHYYDPGYPLNQSSYQALLQSVRRKVPHIHIGTDSTTNLNWGAELDVKVLSGWYGDTNNELGSGNTEINNSSLVLQIRYGEHRFLLMGDAEGKDRADTPDSARYIERRLLQQYGNRLASTLIKLGHHGSETSSSIPFVQQVDPAVVIIQSGRKSYSATYLPDASTIHRIKEVCPRVRVYRTDDGDEAVGYRHFEAVDGDDIEVRSNGRGPLRVRTKTGEEIITIRD